MKLHFENADLKYNGFDSFIRVQVGSSWEGIADVDKTLGEDLVKLPGVSELSDSDWEWYKKKSSEDPVAYRQFGIIKQDSTQNPNATYAQETGSPSQSPTSDKEVIEITVEDVDPPVAEEEPATPKRKGKK
jgi:hypothetical protein